MPTKTARRGKIQKVVAVRRFDPAAAIPMDILTLACGHEIHTVHRSEGKHHPNARCPLCVGLNANGSDPAAVPPLLEAEETIAVENGATTGAPGDGTVGDMLDRLIAFAGKGPGTVSVSTTVGGVRLDITAERVA